MSTKFGNAELESLEYDVDSRMYVASFDRETTDASMAAVAALSDVMDVDPTEMEPLGSVIDTDALDALIGHRAAEENDLSAAFTLGRYELTVSTDGMITVAEPDRPENSSTGLNR